ncbi:uncharacterized protein LOC111016244 [Momordica charantia]|uniref:Protein TILLER ANGLE CONTROL 1 n=1 Tax=Momordica charantia TaxID=3673 RepID=A0A6J1D0S4_MOMCH|nr:uncharacterized protein LOC111016244 [Momordica charantia]
MFNWLHSNFHYNPLKAESKRNVWRKNTKSVAKHVDEIFDVLEDWRINGRRLTICVVGFERSSKPRNYPTEYCNLKKEGKRSDEVVDDDLNDDDDDELSPLMATTFQNNFDDSGEFCIAELFMADADVKPKPAPEENVAARKKPEVKTANGSCSAKKPKEAAKPAGRSLRRVSTTHSYTCLY